MPLAPDGPTIPITTKKGYHYVATLKHDHHNNVYNVDNNNNVDNNINNDDNNIKNAVSTVHTPERSISSPHPNRSGIQYHQRQDFII